MNDTPLGPQRPGAERVTMPGPYRVVIVEDPALARLMKRLLERFGQIAEIALTGREGIELVRSTQPDVVFTRIELPDMPGFQVAREIRSTNMKQPVVVALTAYSKPQIESEAKRSGFDLHLSKPATVEELRDVFAFVAGDENSPVDRY